jgi:hypothetical protein
LNAGYEGAIFEAIDFSHVTVSSLGKAGQDASSSPFPFLLQWVAVSPIKTEGRATKRSCEEQT